MLFACLYAGVLRFGASLGSRRAKPRGGTLSAASLSSAGAPGLSSCFLRLLYEGRAGFPPIDARGLPYANDVNDLGTCATEGMGAPASTAEDVAAALGGAAGGGGDEDSPLCAELLSTEPWRGARVRGRAPSLHAAHIWSAPVCAFLARELRAVAVAAAAGAPANATTAGGRALGCGDGGGAPAGGAPPRAPSGGGGGSGSGGTVAVCGVRVSGGDVARMCGAAPTTAEALAAVPTARLADPYSRDAPFTYFMWNKALAAAMDASPHPMIDDGPKLPLADYTGKLPGARTFYVVTTQLREFIEKVVPLLREPFVVVSGSSDVSGPLAGMGWSEDSLATARKLLANPLLAAYFAQNPDYKHPKMVPLHIGFDFHTIAKVDITEHAWGAPMSVEAQDAELAHLRCVLPPFSQRSPRALMNFKSAGRSVRSQVAQLLTGRPGITYVDNLSRSQLWRYYGEFAFIVSPRGYGKDCHRTWEALALGCAVIVSKDSFLEPLYEDLPVIQIANWDLVTAENLALWQAELAAKWHTFRFEKLRTDFWLDAIRKSARQGSLEGIWEWNEDTRPERGNYSYGRLVFDVLK